MWLISFDIDGTMEFGDPPGILTQEIVNYFRDKGAIVGSASDRPESTQWMMWRKYGIELDFVTLKHRMKSLRDKYPDFDSYWHVGDRPLDQQNARDANFTFFWPDQFPTVTIGDKLFPSDDDANKLTDGNKVQIINSALIAIAEEGLREEGEIQDRTDHNPQGAGRLPGDLGSF
tara:strand:- start:86 stop:607 length:522 start_codon:yes stop_codon:yes gene_type:complete